MFPSLGAELYKNIGSNFSNHVFKKYYRSALGLNLSYTHHWASGMSGFDWQARGASNTLASSWMG